MEYKCQSKQFLGKNIYVANFFFSLSFYFILLKFFTLFFVYFFLLFFSEHTHWIFMFIFQLNKTLSCIFPIVNTMNVMGCFLVFRKIINTWVSV